MAKTQAQLDPKKLEEAKKKVKNNLIYALRKVHSYDAFIKEDRDATKSMTDRIGHDLKNIKKIAEVSTTAEFFMGLNKALAEMGKGAVKSMHAAGKELKDAHSEVAHGAKDFAKENAKHEITDYAADHEEDEDLITAILSTVITRLDEWTSPTWWFYELLRTYEGEPWTETIFHSVGSEFDKKIKYLQAQSAARLHIYDAARTKSQKAMERWLHVERDIVKKLAEAKKK